jgi:hypothetical protein
MSGTPLNAKVIPLPFPRPTRTGAGWSRTWRLSSCSPNASESVDALRTSLTIAGFHASVEQLSEFTINVIIHYATNQDPFSDENFVFRPREILRLVESSLGRIAQIEGVARTLWPPFRPQFSFMVSTSSPALILERFVRNTLAQQQWNRGRIVIPGRPEALQVGTVNFATVNELGLKLAPSDVTPQIQLVVFGDDLVLLAAEDSQTFHDGCEQLETLGDLPAALLARGW